MRHRGSGEHGISTLGALAVVVLIVGIAVIGAGVVAAIDAGSRAGRAADLAALAASSASLDGKDGCDTARRIARENDAELVECRMDADVATVSVRATVATPWGRWGGERLARAAPLSYLTSDR